MARLVVASLAFVVLIVSGYAWAQFRNFTDERPARRRPSPPWPAPTWTAPAQDILLIGNDSRAGATRPSWPRCTPGTT